MNKYKTSLLWATLVVLGVALVSAITIYPEYLWLSGVIGLLFAIAAVALIVENRQSLRSRSAAYGLNSGVMVLLVLCLLGVINFIAIRYPQKLDLTQNKIHTLSDQTRKVISGLKVEVKATYFADQSGRDKGRPLLDNLVSLGQKFKVEYVDPSREPTRAASAGIKRMNTLVLETVAGKESKTRQSQIEDVSEEKITNAVIKLIKDKTQTLCAITGHGERDFASNDKDGLSAIKTSLVNQAYAVKTINLIQEAKVSEDCDAIAILGPTKEFFKPEAKIIEDYLSNGGRALIAFDGNPKLTESSTELVNILKAYHVDVYNQLVIDPTAKLFGADAAMPILVSYSHDSPIVRDFKDPTVMPLARPLRVNPPFPPSLNTTWIAQTSEHAWGESSLSQLSNGAVKYDAGPDLAGPVQLAVSVDGKLPNSKATQNTKMVVFGSSSFVTNTFTRNAGNLDLFMNSASWVLEDESLISIRPKEAANGQIELSQKQGQTIFLLTVFIIPLLTAIAGIVIWSVRRRL